MIDFLSAILFYAKSLVAIVCVMLVLVGIAGLYSSLTQEGYSGLPWWQFLVGIVAATLVGGLCWPKEGEV